MKKTIWIDLDNSPHVPFFAPIIGELESRGFNTWVTARDRFRVGELAKMHAIPHTMVGRDYGKNKIVKGLALYYRALQLLPPVLKTKPDLALSHGSRSQIIVSSAMRIPSITIIDYEHAKVLPFTHCDNIFAPSVIPDESIHINCNKMWKYPGIKEDVYVPMFKPKEGLLQTLGIEKDNVVVTIRPPATDAHYHSVKSEELFWEVISWISTKPGTVMVILPRNESQERIVKERCSDLIGGGKLVVPEKALEGLDLMWHSDLVISGGGTMNREAAALGLPVYSIFKGAIGHVDRYLSASGRLKLIENGADARNTIRLEKRNSRSRASLSNETLLRIVDKIEAVASS